MAATTEAAGYLIAAVRLLVRDAIATCVSRLIVYAAEEATSFGLATPLVVEQVTTLVGTWAAKIAGWLRGLLSSLRRLIPLTHRLAAHIEALQRILTRLRVDHLGPASARQTGGQLRRPRSDLDFEIGWADDAYGHIRASTDDVDAIFAVTSAHGYSRADLELVKDHIFVNEHLLDLYPPPVTARFDANPRMAEAWMRLAEGNPHPSDFDLLAHELHEARYMRDTGNPSYGAAHQAAIDAGKTWDAEAAAGDGMGYRHGG